MGKALLNKVFRMKAERKKRLFDIAHLKGIINKQKIVNQEIQMKKISLKSIREQILGNNLVFDTPFGERHLLYADYTASGRTLESIEKKLLNIQKSYANTHTEDDYSGKYLTTLLHQAEEKIKKLVNAGDHGKIIATGWARTTSTMAAEATVRPAN